MINAEKFKAPINEGNILTPKFSVVGWELSIIGIVGPSWELSLCMATDVNPPL